MTVSADLSDRIPIIALFFKGFVDDTITAAVRLTCHTLAALGTDFTGERPVDAVRIWLETIVTLLSRGFIDNSVAANRGCACYKLTNVVTDLARLIAVDASFRNTVTAVAAFTTLGINDRIATIGRRTTDTTALAADFAYSLSSPYSQDSVIMLSSSQPSS